MRIYPANPPSGQRVPAFARALIIVSLALCCGADTALWQQAASAQRAEPSATQRQQQRPRRVSAPTPQTEPARPAQPAPVREEVDEDDVVRVETQLVTVPVAVTSRDGRPVPGLRAQDFQIFEDGRPQRIANFATTEAPFEVALLLDTSGSTRAELALIRQAANAFIEALRPGDRVAVVAFNTAPEGSPELATVEIKTLLTSDRAELRRAVETIGASNGTPFYDSLHRIATEVFRDPPAEEARGRRALVALTDGVDSTSNGEFAAARARLLDIGIICYFIQVNTEDYVEERLLRDCADDAALRLSRAQLRRYQRLYAARADAADFRNFCQLGPFQRMDISRALYNLARREMNELAAASGGRSFVAEELREARAAFAQVANEIGTQYSIGYYPTNKERDGRFRAIRVQVRGVAGAQVRARAGYQAPSS